MKFSKLSLVAAAGLFAATSVLAQQGAAMVSVDVATIAPAIAKNINVDVSKIPASVQVPVGVAAGACGVSASALVQPSAGGAAACQATTTTAALDQVVQKQLKGAAK
jgi:hypothetical protein